MAHNKRYMILVALVVALGGFVWGFDATVISGAVPFIQKYFAFERRSGRFSARPGGELPWLGRSGRHRCGGFFQRPVWAEESPDHHGGFFYRFGPAFRADHQFCGFCFLAGLGGIAVGGAILIAPVYIAEISPPELRGSMVSLNQFMIVLGISASFFSNYFLAGRGGK